MITSEINHILNVFNNNYIYEIPDFQRDFVWGSTEIERLFKDFLEDTEDFTAEVKNLDGYLLGNIVLINNNHDATRKIVIDGQQRLTTLSLLYKALENVLIEKIRSSGGTELVWAELRSDLKRGYGLFDDFSKFESPKILHHESLKFGEAYRKIIQSELGEIDDIESSADTQINEVFEAITDQLSNLSDNQLVKFVHYIKTKVLIIVTTAPNISKAFQLFEILNNRGKDLEPLDLIKNNLLKNIEEQELDGPNRLKFNQDWTQFIENLEITKSKRIESSTFLKHFLMGTKGENVKKENLYHHFSDEKEARYQNTSSVINLVSDFKRVSKIYSAIEKKNYDLFTDNETSMYILFQLLKLKQMHVMLIPFYFESNDTKEKIIDLAIRLGASVIFSFTPANFIEKELPSKIRRYYSNKKSLGFDNAFEIFVEDIEALIKERAPLAKEATTNRKFENSRGNYTVKGRELLQFIEMYALKNDHVTTAINSKSISLEHILPRKLDLYEPKTAGFKNQDEMREYTNRIGNLALIKKSDNSHLSNGQFSSKRAVFAKSDFLTTKVINGKLETHIKTGKEKILFDQINENLSFTDDGDYWTKGMIIKRSEIIGHYMEKVLINRN